MLLEARWNILFPTNDKPPISLRIAIFLLKKGKPPILRKINLRRMPKNATLVKVNGKTWYYWYTQSAETYASQ